MKQGGGDPSKLLEWLEDKGYIVFDCEFWEPPKLGQPRDFKSYPGTFADWQYQMGNHGQWTDALAIRL